MAEVIEGGLGSWASRAWSWCKSRAAQAGGWIRQKAVALWRWMIRAVVAMGNWRLRTMLLYAAVVVLTIYLGIIAAVFVAVRYLANQIPHNPAVRNIVYLPQGWGTSVADEARQRFYYTAQGTSFVNLRYLWFVHLERADRRERFADPGHMRSLGFIVDNVVTPDNPYQLPVGFTQHFDPDLKEQFLDFTCAACHTGELHVTTKQGEQVAIRIDGGQAMHAFTSARPGHFGPGLMAAMTATYLNPWKWSRFSHNVLGAGYGSGNRHLRVEFGKMLLDLLATALSDTVHGKYPIDEGFGRTDAIARISNRVFGDEIDHANYVKGDAPVSYPAVWDASRFDWVQYAGSVSQPLARNLGEALGTGAAADLLDAYGQPVPMERRFTSQARIEALVAIEQTIEKLQPPKWPEQILGAIDQKKAEAGRKLYETHCAHCHEPCLLSRYETAVRMPLRPVNDPLWHVNLIPIEEVGTDPQAALNFYNYRVNLEKTGLKEAEIRPLLEAELRDQAMREVAFAGLKEVPPGAPAGASIQPLDLRERLLTDLHANRAPQLAPETEAAIKQQLDAIDIRSASIGQGLNYLGLLLRKMYFADHDSATSIQIVSASSVGQQLAQLRSLRSGFRSGAAPGRTKPPSENYGTSPEAEQQKLDSEDIKELIEGYGALDIPQVKKVYKARPLGGVWATAPYLHDGSVPNLYEMLVPRERRSRRFFISRMNFDPVTVGLVKDKMTDKGFWYDTSIPGNLNIGHEFRAGYGGSGPGATPSPGVIGPELKEDERWALVEYLKIHVDSPKPCEQYPQGKSK